MLLEGERLISQVILNGHLIKEIYTTEKAIRTCEKTIQKLSCPIYLIRDSQADELSETQNSQGLFAVIEFQTLQISKWDRLLYLNGISDPGNLGTIIRTAASFSIDGIVLDENCCDIANSKVIRASLGAVFEVPFYMGNEEWLFSRKEKIIVSDVHGGKQLDQYAFPKSSFIFVIGSEAEGVSQPIINRADEIVNITSSGKMESLNVAVATGIFLYKMNSDLSNKQG